MSEGSQPRGTFTAGLVGSASSCCWHMPWPWVQQSCPSSPARCQRGIRPLAKNSSSSLPAAVFSLLVLQWHASGWRSPLPPGPDKAIAPHSLRQCPCWSFCLLLPHWRGEYFFFFFYFFKFYFIFKLYNIVLVLPNIEMNPPQVYMCSPSWDWSNIVFFQPFRWTLLPSQGDFKDIFLIFLIVTL